MQPKKVFGLALHWQIGLALLIGLPVGLLVNLMEAAMTPETWGMGLLHAFDSGSRALGTLFLRLLRMVIVPLVVSSIICGVISAGGSKNLGRLGVRTFGYYILSSLIAILIGLGLTNLFQPGRGVEMPAADTISATELKTPESVSDILTPIIPLNPVAALVEGDMLAIIFFSILFGAAITCLDETKKSFLADFFDAAFQAMMRLTVWVMQLAPIGVYGLIFTSVRTLDLTHAGAIARYMVVLASGLTLHLFVALPLLFYLFTRRNPYRQMRHMAAAMLTAFSTSSSAATLPVTMECLEEIVGVPNRSSSFVLPLGATVNMDGTARFECVGALYNAQIMVADLTVCQQVTVVLTALLASIGAAAVPSAGLVVLFIVLDAVGLHGEQVGLIVGTMLAVDRPLDMYRTVVNIFSDSVGATIVADADGLLPAES